MKLVSDDFGLGQAANALVIEAIDKKLLWGASVMVSMPGTKPAFDYIASQPLATRYGLHLNLTEGQPLSDPGVIPTLIDTQGRFLGWNGLITASLFHRIDPRQIETETRAQLEALQSTKKPIDFLNSHHHIHLWPAFAKIIRPLVKEYSIASVRSPKKIWWPGLAQAHWSKSFAIQVAGIVSHYPADPIASYLVDLDWSNSNEIKRKEWLKNLPNDTELICHPLVFDGSKGPATLEWLIKDNHHA